MIAPIQTSSDRHRTDCVQDQFLSMLPQIRRQAFVAFRSLNAEARDEAVQEVIANAYRAWVRLVRQGKQAVVYASPLAQYAILQVRDGRRVGCRKHALDVMFPEARRRRGFRVERLDRLDPHTGAWKELLVEDRKAGPAETAAARIDVAAWFRTLSKRNRRIARALAMGGTTGAVAQQFGLTAGRVSQLRGWFRAQWERFQGGGQVVGAAA